MGIQYTKTTQNLPAGNDSGPAQETEVVPFDIGKERTQLNDVLVNSPEVDAIVSTICVEDPQTVVSFGAQAAEEISKCSDVILRSVNMQQINDSGELLNTLGKIMDKFDLDEIVEEKKGIFSKLFGDMKKQLNQILDKYHTMGEEVDKIYIKLKQYEGEIQESNQKLEAMFQTNLGYYQELVKYILAGEQGCRELEQLIADRQGAYQQSPNAPLQMEISNLQQIKEMLEQRTQDLRIAESVAMQSIPMIRTMQFSNLNLIRKINSAFIITLPVFKQALTQAILLKRQKIQAEAMSALDEKTNEMLLKNAQNSANQSKLAAQLVSSSSVKVETLEQTWQTILKGIQETRQIQEDAKKKREEDIVRLNALKADYNAKLGSGTNN